MFKGGKANLSFPFRGSNRHLLLQCSVDKLGYRQLFDLLYSSTFFYLQHHHYITALINRVCNASSVIHQQALLIDNLWKEIEGLRKDGAPIAIAEVEARGAELAWQLEQTGLCLANLTKQLKEVQSNNWDDLLQLTRQLDSMRVHNSELGEQVLAANEQAQELKDALEAKQCMIPKYREEVVIDYKASTRFKKGLERIRVILYQFGYQIALAYFKTRYPKIKLKEGPFIALFRCLNCHPSLCWSFVLMLLGQFT